MRSRIVLGLTATVLSVSASFQDKEWTVDQLSWMAGCWNGGSGNLEISEQWMRPSGGTMLGMSRTVAGGKTVEFEFLQIRRTDDGAIAYIAKPSRQAETSFTLVKLTDSLAVFENPAHDFPRRIIYRLQPDGSLHARIEGSRGGQERGIDFPYRRGVCP